MILAAYLASKGYVKISQLNFAECLEINAEKNLYEYKLLLSFPLVFLFSISFIGLPTWETQWVLLMVLLLQKNGLLLLLNGLFEIGLFFTIKGRFPNQSILDWLSMSHT